MSENSWFFSAITTDCIQGNIGNTSAGWTEFFVWSNYHVSREKSAGISHNLGKSDCFYSCFPLSPCIESSDSRRPHRQRHRFGVLLSKSSLTSRTVREVRRMPGVRRAQRILEQCPLQNGKGLYIYKGNMGSYRLIKFDKTVPPTYRP